MGQGDYDARTALHIAASEGHLESVQFLVDKCNVNPEPQDRLVGNKGSKRFNYNYYCLPCA